MRLRLGGRQVGNTNLVNQITDYLMDGVGKKDAIVLSGLRLDRMAENARQAALLEAQKIYSTIFEQIQSGQNRVLGTRLLNGAPRSAASSPRVGGIVPWRALTRDYVYQKLHNWRRWPIGRTISRSTAANGGFFIYQAILRDQFRRPTPATFMTRLGGITVHVDHQRNDALSNAGGHNRLVTLFQEQYKQVLARIIVTIFPKLNPGNAPMLNEGGRWNSVSGNSNIESLLYPDRTRQKLTNPKGEQRHLVLPITQFYMAVRIPAAIREAMDRTAAQGRYNIRG